MLEANYDPINRHNYESNGTHKTILITLNHLKSSINLGIKIPVVGTID